MIVSYGRKDGLKGLEAEYEIKEKSLYIKIQGSNSWQDYVWDFLTFPRKKYNGKKYHWFWFKQSKKFAEYLKEKGIVKSVDNIFIIGHSMGGANAAILPVFFPDKKFIIELVNAPKMGNKKAMQWLENNTQTIAFYDRGDVVRRLPLLYHKYFDNRSYGKTKPFWKAHANFPLFWDKFFNN